MERLKQILGLMGSVVLTLTVARADEPPPDEVTLEMAAGFHHRSARHPLNVSTGQPTLAACIGVQGQKNPFKDKTTLVTNPPATLGDQGDLTTPDWVFLGEGASYLKVTEYYTVRGEITIRLYDGSDTCIKSYTIAKEGLESGGASQVQQKEILLWDVDDSQFTTNRVKKFRVTAGTTPPQGAHNAGGYALLTARVAVGVDLQFQNMSATVADGMATHTMGESEEESEGAELRINANFDEGNTQNGYPLEDYLRNDRVVSGDADLLVGSAVLCTATTEDTFSFELEKVVPSSPTAIVMWVQKANGQWALVQWGNALPVTDFPVVGGLVTARLLVEGVEGSRCTKDHRVKVNFRPKNAVAPLTDTVFITIVKTEFMLSFDDGPYSGAGRFGNSPMILDKLRQVFTSGGRVSVAFFHVGLDGSRGFLIDRLWWPKEGVRRNPLISQRVSNEGHLLGNHTQHHYLFEMDTPAAVVEQEIRDCEAEITNSVQNPPRYFRPPYLSDFNGVRQGTATAGHALVWGKTFGEADPFFLRTLDVLEDRIKLHLAEWHTKGQPIRKGKPAVLILHDFRSLVYEHIDEIIAHLARSGFVLVNFNPADLSGDSGFYTAEPPLNYGELK